MDDDVYWLADAPLTGMQHQAFPASCDVAVVGAGFTGLSAALTLARAGRSVVVFDKNRPGEGASTRNGGITSGNIRPGHAALSRRFGEARATAILAEAKLAREDLYRFVADEKIDCDLRLTGRFSGAASPEDYERLARTADMLVKMGIEAYAVPRSEQRNYIGTALYHGGAVRMDTGGLHPAKLHAGMLALVLQAGVAVHGETAVTDVREASDGFEVATARGSVRARFVVVGTNGYADQADRWLRRRLVPVRSRIIVTEPLSPNLMADLMPRGMVANDTRRLSSYYRPTPDGRRILFGGRDTTTGDDPTQPTNKLRRDLGTLFPVLQDVPVSHSWFGHVAMNRDMIPRIFSRKGVRYAAGYCGSGTVWARWAGQKVAYQILEEADGASALDFRPPPAVPLYAGRPWFMPAAFAWMALRDRVTVRRHGQR